MSVRDLRDGRFSASNCIEAHTAPSSQANLYDAEPSSDLKMPLTPENGDFLLSGSKLNLDPAGAFSLNDALEVKTFASNLYVGYAGSVVFVPLEADGM